MIKEYTIIIQCLVHYIKDVSSKVVFLHVYYIWNILDQSTDVEQWTEIEDDAKKLHELVELQRNQINEIVSLITETGDSFE